MPGCSPIHRRDEKYSPSSATFFYRDESPRLLPTARSTFPGQSGRPIAKGVFRSTWSAFVSTNKNGRSGFRREGCAGRCLRGNRRPQLPSGRRFVHTSFSMLREDFFHPMFQSNVLSPSFGLLGFVLIRPRRFCDY